MRNILLIILFCFILNCISIPKFEEHKQTIDCYYLHKDLDWQGDKRFIYQIFPFVLFLAGGFIGMTASFANNIGYLSFSFFSYGEIRVFFKKKYWLDNNCRINKI